jgi:hypothetical protein
MAQALHSPQRYRGFILTAVGLQKLHGRVKQLEAQTRVRQSPRTIAERVQLSEPDGIHPITVRKILDGQNGVDKRSIQLVFQVLQLRLEEGDCAHAGLCQRPAAVQPETSLDPPVEVAHLPKPEAWSETASEAKFYGRSHELIQLNQAIVAERCRFIQILGMAGVGKTALATALAKTVQSEFEIIIWQSLHHAPAIQTVLTNTLRALIKRTGRRVELPTQVEALSRLLIEQFQNYRCLLVFDRFNSVLWDHHYAGYCRPGYEAYTELLRVVAEVSHQSCLVITSREKPRVGMAEECYLRSLQLHGFLPPDYQQIVNHYPELVGTVDQWRSLIEQCNGNPFILKTVAACVQNYFSGRISDYLTHLKSEPFLFGDLRDLLSHQFNRLSLVEQELVCRLALWQSPVLISQFRETISLSLNQQPCLEGLDSLDRRSMLHWQGGYFALAPLMKLYVEECLMEQRDDTSSKPKLKLVSNQASDR